MEENISDRIVAKFKSIIQRIGTAFRQERTRELFTFLGFVLLSLIFWFMQGLNEEVENSFKIPIELQNLPEKTTLINDLPSHIEVRVRDKGPVMLGYAIEGLSPLRINFQEYDKGRNSFLLLSSQLQTKLRKSLRSSTSIVSIIPDTLKVMYTHNAGKRVKLVVKGVASTTPQCVLSGDMTADVDSVMVYGESSLLKRVKEVYTTEQVTVTIPVEEMTSKILDIPVIPQNVPSNWSLITFPSSVQLSCMMPFSKFAAVDEDSFLLGVDFLDLSRRRLSDKLGVKILNAPEYVRNIVLSQDSVDYILEQKRPAFVVPVDAANRVTPDSI